MQNFLVKKQDCCISMKTNIYKQYTKHVRYVNYDVVLSNKFYINYEYNQRYCDDKFYREKYNYVEVPQSKRLYVYANLETAGTSHIK